MLPLKNNTILIIPDNIKNNTIINIRKKGLYNIKFMTFKELIHKFYFTYNKETIYYLINKYHYKYEIAKKYLDNLYYIDNINNPKIKYLIRIKKELDDNNLLIYDNIFRNSLQNKEIIIYGYYNLKKYQIKVLEEIKKYTKISINKDNNINNYNHIIHSFNNIEEEVAFIAESICQNIQDNININNIKIYYNNSIYDNYLKRIFKQYNIPINLNISTIYSTTIGKYLIDNLDSDINNTLTKIETTFNLNNKSLNNIYNQIINILNDYTFCKDYLTIKELLIHDLKNTKISNNKLQNEVSIITDLNSANNKDYVYIIGFNQGDIPNIHKDEDYLDDQLKEKLNIDTSKDINIYEQQELIYHLNRLENITITYKLSSREGINYISSINDYLNYPIEKTNLLYNHSNIYNKLVLSSKIDTYLKYNEKESNLDILYNTYPKLNYGTYNNNFTKLNTNKLKEYLDNKLTLSYSSINDYYHCSFKYYLSYILKLNIYTENFMTIVGNTFHYVLSICFEKNIDIAKEYDKYLEKTTYQFNSKEQYFLDKLKEELIFIINTIKEQYQYNSLTNTYYEEKITIDKEKNDMKIIFKGFIDKLMLDNNNEIGAIIDYKTGSPNLDLNNTIYGLDLQLPVYIYLTKYRFPNIRIVGFYLQKIINTTIKRDIKKTYLDSKKDNLKLQGYTNTDENIIKLLDSSYQNSLVIKGMKTTSTGLGTKKVLNDIKIDKLSNLVDNKIDNAISNIIDANFPINPKRIGKDNIGCQYCQYQDICYIRENNIINLKQYKNSEFLDNE